MTSKTHENGQHLEASPSNDHIKNTDEIGNVRANILNQTASRSFASFDQKNDPLTDGVALMDPSKTLTTTTLSWDAGNGVEAVYVYIKQVMYAFSTFLCPT